MRTVAYRYQRTLAQTVDVSGIGFITGATVRARFQPAPENTGIVFVRSDRPNAPRIRATAQGVSDTRRRTTIGSPDDGVTLVEHVLAALSGLHIHNCTIVLNGPEPPGLDGSAIGFVRAIRNAGIQIQYALQPIRTVSEPVTVARDGACVTLHPAQDEQLRISYILNYGNTSPIPRQMVTADITPELFEKDIASCRTFVLEHEARELRAQGVGRGVQAKDLLVFGANGPIDNLLHCADEPARHKILDLVGDLALTGWDLAGHVVAYRSGHGLNVDLARQIQMQEEKSTAPAVISFPAWRRAA